MKFLILSASTGNGHISASNALVDELRQRGHEAEWIDCMDNVSPMFKRWFKGGYEMLVRESPWFWGHLYRTSDRPLFNYWVQTFLDYKCCWPLDQVIRDFKPDMIICTHSVAQPRLPAIRREIGCPVVTVVTDLYPHRMWLRGRPDWYFLPTEESQRELYRRVPNSKGRSTITGIPINEAFAKALPREAAKTKLGLPLDDPMILISSGGIGAGPFDEVAQMLASMPVQLQIVAGRNEQNLARLRELFLTAPNVTIHGQVSQEMMAELMASADILIGKSGGLTTFEALAVGVPFLVYRPFLIPGQEEDNAEFLERVGAGRFIRELPDLKAAVEELLASPSLREKMSEAAKSHAQPNARGAIVDKVLELARPLEQKVKAKG